MRLEDKEVDGIDLERHERLEETELVEPREDDLEGATELRDVDLERRDLVLATVQAILAREHVVIDELPLAARELRALEALQAAVLGRDPALARIVFATDRGHLLEQALAILQPSLAELPQGFDLVVERVAQLRDELGALEDSQDDTLKAIGEQPAVARTGDDDAKPDGDASLTGPERPEPARPPSSLTGPERAEPARPPSSLTGPERAEPAKPPSSLGDPAELAAQAKRPWWRRPDE